MLDDDGPAFGLQMARGIEACNVIAKVWRDGGEEEDELPITDGSKEVESAKLDLIGV